jgi:hypothetical protein
VKVSVVALAAVLGLAASSAHADPATGIGTFDVSCGAMVIYVGDRGHGDPVASTDISRNASGNWTVVHHMVSGKTYARNNQYEMSDIANAKTAEWRGSLRGHTNILMDGVAFAKGGHLWYEEMIYDTNVPITGQFGKVVGHSIQDCGAGSATPVSAGVAARPLGTEPGSLSTYLGQ